MTRLISFDHHRWRESFRTPFFSATIKNRKTEKKKSLQWCLLVKTVFRDHLSEHKIVKSATAHKIWVSQLPNSFILFYRLCLESQSCLLPPTINFTTEEWLSCGEIRYYWGYGWGRSFLEVSPPFFINFYLKFYKLFMKGIWVNGRVSHIVISVFRSMQLYLAFGLVFGIW